MIYLTNAVDIPKEYQDGFGFLASSIHARNEKTELARVAGWILDNDAFNGNFDVSKWITFMLNHKRNQDTCIGVTIPDVIGDAFSTLIKFSKYHQIVKDLGYRVAFVTQDGITPEITPWDNFDTLFVGGLDEHKMGSEAGAMIAVAKRLGKWVHIGRVNSESRIKSFWFADSVDGTQFSIIGKGSNGQSRKERQLDDIKRFYAAVLYCRNRKNGRVNNSDQYNFYGVHDEKQAQGRVPTNKPNEAS